jgi:hypothetical protein
MLIETNAEEGDPSPEMMAVDAVLLIGCQWIDEDGDRCGSVNVLPRNGCQPAYATAGLLTAAHARVTDP